MKWRKITAITRFKVIHGPQSEALCDFLVVNNTKLHVHPISHRFQDIAEVSNFCCR